jgi:hypothetical protein
MKSNKIAVLAPLSALIVTAALCGQTPGASRPEPPPPPPLAAIPAGTSIPIRTNDPIRMKDSSDGRVFTGIVDRDVLDDSGRLAIRRGAAAELIVRNVSNKNLTLDLDSVTIEGRRYAVSAGDVNRDANAKDGVGRNMRTMKYVGGGALIGTVIGAIAGGGTGAVLGLLAGAGAGAGTQIVTKGHTVNVPAESILTFRLERPLTLGAPDDGFTRDGRHYHQQGR